MKIKFLLFILICWKPATCQVSINYNVIEGSFVKEDIYNFSIFNQTNSEVNATLQGSITTPNNDVIYSFEVSEFNIKIGNNIINKDSLNIIVHIDNYNSKTIEKGFIIKCSLVHPIDKKAVISNYSTYYIPIEVGIEKTDRTNIPKTFRYGNPKPDYHTISFYQPTKTYETRELIIGIENTIRVNVSKFKCAYLLSSNEVHFSRVKLFCDNSSVKIQRDSNGIYKITPRRESKNIRLKIKIIEDAYFTEKEYFFGLKHLPPPIPYLGTNKNGKISLKELDDLREIAVRFGEYNQDILYDITSYEIKIIKGNKIKFQTKNKGQKFQAHVLKEIRSLNNGDMLIFENIRCIYPGRKWPHKISDLIIHVE